MAKKQNPSTFVWLRSETLHQPELDCSRGSSMYPNTRQDRPCWWGIRKRTKATRSVYPSPKLDSGCKEKAFGGWSDSEKIPHLFKSVPAQWKCQTGSNSACFCLAVKSFAWSWLGLTSYGAACMTHLCHSLSEQRVHSLGQSLPLPQSCTTPRTHKIRHSINNSSVSLLL